MKRFIAMVAGFLAMSLSTAAFAAEAGKIGFVEMQKVVGLSDAGKEAKEQLNVKAKKYQDELNAKQEELKKLRDDLEKQGVILSESARSTKEKEYQQKLKEFQRYLKDVQDEVQAKEEELLKKLQEEIVKVVQEYGRKNGFSMIFARVDEVMIFTDEKADLTDEVLKAYNTSKKKK
ncbi:MAG: OmpH family outer membrane protein [Geobacter sp.]|nr:OmpH family outer membrane protein [Geobacter sp.]